MSGVSLCSFGHDERLVKFRYVLLMFTFKMVDELDKIYPEFIGEWVKEGFHDKLVIIGFPYDIGARQAG